MGANDQQATKVPAQQPADQSAPSGDPNGGCGVVYQFAAVLTPSISWGQSLKALRDLALGSLCLLLIAWAVCVLFLGALASL